MGRGIALLAVVLICAVTSPAEAQYRSVTVTYMRGNTPISKTIHCKGVVPGTLRGAAFTPFKKRINELKSKGIAGRRLKEAKSLLAAGRPACAQDDDDPVINGNFDGWGNVTERGKIAFQIPLYLNATIGEGRAVHERFCTDCHAERLNYTYPEIRERTGMAPMFFTVEELSDQDVARLTAFYNRFNP